MKIGTKLIIAFSSIIALTVFLGIYSLLELRTLNENGNIIYEKTTIPLGLLVKTTDLEQEMRLQVREWKIGKTDAEREAAIKVLDEDNVILKNLIAEQKDRSIGEEARILLDNLVVVADRYVMEAHNYIRSNTVRMACGMTEADIPHSLLESGKELREAVSAIINAETLIAKEISEKNSQIAKRAIRVTFIVLILAGIVSLGFSFKLTSYITGALKTVVHVVSKIEKGDMTARSEFKREDEFGMLSNSINSLAYNLQEILKGLNMDSGSLASSSEELSVVSNQLVNLSEEGLQQSITVTSTTEQVSININKMAKDAERTAVNTDNVAGDVEQVSNSIREITKIANEATDSVSVVTDVARQMSANMSVIVNTFKDMKMITEQISGYTNEIDIIAEDAIIRYRKATEAASKLGAAVMDISNAKNADDTAHRINGIQASIDEVVTAIDSVSGIIIKVNEKVKSISGQVSQQIRTGSGLEGTLEQASTSTKYMDEYISHIVKNSKSIANNVMRVSINIERIVKSVNEIANSGKNIAHSAEVASKGTKLISYNAKDMNRATHNSVQGAKQVSKNANELARIASDLKRVVERFRV